METLSSHTGAPGGKFRLIDPREYMHVIIDVQREFCDPLYGWEPRGTAETAKIADDIVSAAGAFRKAGFPTAIIYYASYPGEKPGDSCGGFYKISPALEDTVLGKIADSAFAGGHIDDHLRAKNIKSLLLSGFNFSVCVKHTALDALKKGYEVTILTDCTGNGRGSGGVHYQIALNDLTRAGAVFATSADILKRMKPAGP